MTDNTSTPPAPAPDPKAPSTKSMWPRYVIILAVVLVSLGTVFYMIATPRQTEHGVVEEVLEGEQAEELAINKAHTIDAIGRREVEAKEGYRYRVVIDDEAREGTAGIARIGGLVTFIPGARKGETLVVEVTRVKRSTADAAIVKRLSSSAHPAPLPEKSYTPEELATASRRGPVEAGKLYRAVISEAGKRGDGIARVDGMVVFVAGGQPGEDVTFEVTKLAERFAVASLIARHESAKPNASPSAAANAARPKSPADDVQPGATFEVTVSEQDRKDPTRNGVARIGGLVVFVPESQPGDHVRIRITDRRPRFAFSEVVERLPTEP